MSLSRLFRKNYFVYLSAFILFTFTLIPFSRGQGLPPRTDLSKRVGIVYSQTTATRYWNAIAYSQLFMVAQHQAMMAGVPFDLLTEQDLTTIDNLVNYDALIFPYFANVPNSLLASIQTALRCPQYPDMPRLCHHPRTSKKHLQALEIPRAPANRALGHRCCLMPDEVVFARQILHPGAECRRL